MSYQSAELKLRTLAAANATLAAALTFTVQGGASVFCWFDRQLAQGDLGAKADGRCCVTVQRVSTMPRQLQGNQGGPVQNISQPRFQVNVVSYNAEQARQVARLVSNFMMSVSLLANSSNPSQNPNFLLNERAGMLPQLQPPAYTEIQDWRVWNNEGVPA